MTKRDRMAKALKAQTLKCEDCGGTAYALWSRTEEVYDSLDRERTRLVHFGLCKPCEDKMRVEAKENRRNAGLEA